MWSFRRRNHEPPSDWFGVPRRRPGLVALTRDPHPTRAGDRRPRVGIPAMMIAEAVSAQKDAEPSRPEATAASPDSALNGGHAATVSAGWLGHELLSRPANASVRTLAVRGAEQTYGNRFVQRMVSKPTAGLTNAHVVQRQCACGGTCPSCKAAGAMPDSATREAPAAAAQTRGAESSVSGRDVYFAAGEYFSFDKLEPVRSRPRINPHHPAGPGWSIGQGRNATEHRACAEPGGRPLRSRSGPGG